MDTTTSTADALRVANRYAGMIQKTDTSRTRAQACLDAAQLYQRDAQANQESAENHLVAARTVRDPAVARQHARAARDAEAEAAREILAARCYEAQSEQYGGAHHSLPARPGTASLAAASATAGELRESLTETDLQFDDRDETPALTTGAIGAGAPVPATTAAAATPVGDVAPAGPGGVYFGADDDDDAVYLDWSSHREDGARGLEVGGGDEAVVIEVTPTDLRDLRDELARTLARDAADPTVAGDLVAGDGNDALYPRGQRDAYLDWSTRNDDGSRNVEVGAGDEAVVVRLDREQLQELHDAIGEQIIADRANVDPGEVRAGQLVFDAVTARLPDRAPGEKYDITARLELDQDPGWRDRTAAATERALRLYRCSTYREVAAYLRAGDDYVDANLTIREHPGRAPTRESVTTHVALIDQAMEAAPLKAPVRLWRGVRDAPAVFGDQWRENMVGAQWTEESFPSTSADPQVGLVFADEVLLRLHVPAGVGAVQLSSWTNRQNANREAEVLLERRLRMRVVADQVEPVGEGGGVTYHGTGDDMQMRVAPPPTRRVLDVEVTPAPPDDDEEPEPAAPAVGPALSSDERRAQAWPIADSEALTDHERLTRPTAPAADQPTPQWRHIVTQQEPPAPTRSAEPIRLPNNGADQGLMHLDSAIGVAWQQLGDDRHLDVGGHALGNILTDLGEGITLNRHNSSHALDRLRELRDRVPAGGRAAQVLDRAVARLDAPYRPEPELPAGTPEPLRTLMRELNAIPLVRRGGDTGYGGGEVWHETDRLADAARRWMAGELSPARFEGELEQLSMGRHEMAEGYTEIREAFGRALGTYRQWRLPPTRTNRSQEA